MDVFLPTTQVPRYLEQILNTLRTNQIVKSTRGARGGYELAHEPHEITVGDIIRSLEGPFDIAPCTNRHDCDRNALCVTCTVWDNVKEQVENLLNGITLQDLVVQYKSKARKQGVTI